MPTKRARKPWFWQQPSPLYWEGWLNGGLAVLGVQALTLAFAVALDIRATVLILVTAVLAAVLPYCLGMLRWLKAERDDLARRAVVRAQIERMIKDGAAPGSTLAHDKEQTL